MPDSLNFEATCKDLSALGSGVFDHPSGKVVFVPGTWPGDRATIEVKRWKKNYGFGDLKELLEPSAARTAPGCSYQGFKIGKCGGCSWMIAEYASQLEYKDHLVRQSLERKDLITRNTQIHKTQPAPQQLGYRNRAQLKTDGSKLGFMSAASNEIVDIKRCAVLNDATQATLTSVRKKLPNKKWGNRSGKQWNQIEIDDWTNPDSVSPGTTIPFRQGNSEQNKYMSDWLATKLAAIKSPDKVLELFAGSGNFTSVLAKSRLGNVLAVEGSAESIKQLSQREIPGVRTLQSDLYNPNSIEKIQQLCTPKLLLLDPPRTGFSLLADYCHALPSLEKIIYISCDISSFTRDVAALKDLGWILSDIQPVDQFPHTPHIEILSVLKRAKRPADGN